MGGCKRLDVFGTSYMSLLERVGDCVQCVIDEILFAVTRE